MCHNLCQLLSLPSTIPPSLRCSSFPGDIPPSRLTVSLAHPPSPVTLAWESPPTLSCMSSNAQSRLCCKDTNDPPFIVLIPGECVQGIACLLAPISRLIPGGFVNGHVPTPWLTRSMLPAATTYSAPPLTVVTFTDESFPPKIIV